MMISKALPRAWRVGALAVLPVCVLPATAAPGSTGTWEPGAAVAVFGRFEPAWPVVLGIGLTVLTHISRQVRNSGGGRDDKKRENGPGANRAL
jgi:hypothetical protein